MLSERAFRARLPAPAASLLASVTALLVLCPALPAQEAAVDGDLGTGTITGLVVEAETDRPLVRASVRLDGERRVLTGPDGRFRFGKVAPGGHEVAVDYLGFRGARQTVAIDSSESVTLRLVLKRDVVEVAELVVEMPRTRASWVREDLQRIFRNGGRVYTHRELDRMGMEFLDGLFRRIPGYDLVGDVSDVASVFPHPRASSSVNVLLSVHGRVCPARLYLDGAKVPAFYLEQILTEEVAAVAILAGPQSVVGECGEISVLSRREAGSSS